MKKILTICGPTGIGKTGFAIRLARAFDGEIIGADSMQIYKHMNIGTAKPDEEEREQVVHHMVDFLDPKIEFDAGQYARQAGQVIDELAKKGKMPIVAGGTGFYIRALLYGLFRSRPVCEKTISRLTEQLHEKGSSYLYEQLKACDPAAAQKIHPNDSFRLVRALEVYSTTGKPISHQQQDHDFKDQKFESLTLGLSMDRERLYERINKRVDMMMDQGLLREVADLVEKGYSLDLKSMQSIGYRHMGMFLKEEVDLDEAVRLLKRDTRRYAKRQFTWFKKEPGIIWVNPEEFSRAQQIVNDFLT
ncbi:tRNA (adenosine(37)-N6)-dimethylallyltransferase MiaA [Desulfospira joergensenii]|uniref:tRNA (adenosine(37)-N6)-dimethylallyltransferase MiaA n=1 Tax=Desulfospira joergensenii TaxID=53329 RepID=UPI0003B54745|nr:tRNA (adenosine(37)-N6)-dimethylallyltransferase MiaA [Desulfospira joergensenii]